MPIPKDNQHQIDMNNQLTSQLIILNHSEQGGDSLASINSCLRHNLMNMNNSITFISHFALMQIQHAI